MIKLKRPIKENESKAVPFKREFPGNGEATTNERLVGIIDPRHEPHRIDVDPKE